MNGCCFLFKGFILQLMMYPTASMGLVYLPIFGCLFVVNVGVYIYTHHTWMLRVYLDMYDMYKIKAQLEKICM